MDDDTWSAIAREWDERGLRPGEADELFVLRQYGIGAHEAENVIPDWEIASLLERHNHHHRKT